VYARRQFGALKVVVFDLDQTTQEISINKSVPLQCNPAGQFHLAARILRIEDSDHS
jgi:hypothetical protein